MEQAYWARFFKEEDGRYSVDVPDLPGCCTFGDDWGDAMRMARKAVYAWLADELADLAGRPAAPVAPVS